MTDERQRCQATTKAGKPCKNWAQDGSDTCHMHAAAAPAAAAPAANPAMQAELDQLVQELNDLAAKLQSAEPEFTPPPYSPANLVKLIRQNIDRFTPEAQRNLLREMQESLQGASARDLLDPATWKGMATLLVYSLQNETAGARARINEQLVKLPGGDTLVSLQEMLEGSSPKDLLDPETWKGMWYLVNYSLQNQAQDVKRRILGEEE